MNLSRNGKWGIVAVMAVALVAAGAAFAATKIHTGGPSTANGRFGGGPPPGLGGGYGFDRDGDHRGPGPDGGLSAAATYLGIDAATLFQDLRNGKTLAQIADATSGKSASGLIDALVKAAESRFGGSGPSEAQIRARITAMVNGTGFGFGHDRGFGGPPSAPTTTTPPTHI